MPAERAGGSRPRVVVTGIGSVSALGTGGGAAVGSALARGLSGIGPSARLPRPRAAGVASGARSATSRRICWMGKHAGWRAPVSSRWSPPGSPSRTPDLQPGQLVDGRARAGSHWGDFRSSETFALGFLERGLLALSPLVFPNTVMNAMAAQVAIAVGVRGPMLTLNEVDVAGELAVARGAALIVAGRASTVLAGGSDELSPTLYRELSRLGIMSPSEPGPEGCRPFDRRASGTVLGEGGTFLVLEAAETALARGARVYGELAGAGLGEPPGAGPRIPDSPAARPAGRSTVPSPRRVSRAEAMEIAYLTGSGHPAHDACELDLVARALGSRTCPLDGADAPDRRARGPRCAPRRRGSAGGVGLAALRAARSRRADPSGSPVRRPPTAESRRARGPDGAGSRTGTGRKPRRARAAGLGRRASKAAA